VKNGSHIHGVILSVAFVVAFCPSDCPAPLCVKLLGRVADGPLRGIDHQQNRLVQPHDIQSSLDPALISYLR
jgi:hypothetical protein